MKLLKGKLVACLGLLVLGISLSGASTAALYFTTISINPSSKTCTVPQDGVSTSCNITFNWTTEADDVGEPTASRTLLINYTAVASSNSVGTFSHTVNLPIGSATYSLSNTSVGDSSGVITAVRGDYTPLFTHSPTTHNTITGDFSGNGEADAYYQNKVTGTVGGIMPVAANGLFDSTIHKSWTTTHPQITAIADWSEEAYAAFSGNFNSNPGDELLLLGTKLIILLHGDIITPITVFQPVNNAIVSWNGSNSASHAEFEFDANPADYVVHIGDLSNDGSGDGYSEIFLQAKSKGGTSYILSNTGALVQTIKNGYRNMDWSAASYSIEISGGHIELTALNSVDDYNEAYTNSSGVITSLQTVVTKPTISGISQKYVFEGLAYSFIPDVTSSINDFTFSVTGKPSWMSLNTSTGELSGTPGAGDTNKSHAITLTVEENKSHTIKSSMSFDIEVTQTFTIGQVDYSMFIATDGTLYLVSVETQEVIKIVDDNGSLIALLSSLLEYNESGASSLTGYQIVFEDTNFDGHIDMVLVPDDGSDLERIVISYIDADVHEVIVGDAPMRDDLDHGPDTLPSAVNNPLDGLDAGTKVVGSLPAEFSVSPSGSAVYDVPIIVAPGSGGMVPNISIAYDSLAGNGLLGVGWNIKGLSGISVCQENREQDGILVPSKFGEGTFCLNGKKLYKYENENNRYATEDKTSINIIYDGTSEFVEYHTNGTKSIFRKESLDYLLYRNVDASGNYTEMVYERDENESTRLKKILYTGNEVTGILPYNAIVFAYQPRTDNIYKFSKGLQNNVTKRLRTISSKVNTDAIGNGGSELRIYTLNYIYGGVSKRSLLEGIAACRMSTCLPETTFDWQQGNQEFASEYEYENGSRYNNSKFGVPWGYLFLDFNGDGVRDYWKNTNDGGSNDDLLIITGGDTFNEKEVFDEYLSDDIRKSIKVIDYNNDGKDDLIYDKDGFWHINLAKEVSGSRFHDFGNLINTGIPVETNEFEISTNDSILIADHNGDGYPDFTFVHENKIWLRYNLNTNLTGTPNQNLFSDAIELIIPGLTDGNIPSGHFNLSYFFRNIERLFLPVDLDGDGIVEYQIGIPSYTSANDDGGTFIVGRGDWKIFKKQETGVAEITANNEISYAYSLGEWDDFMDVVNRTYDRFDLRLIDLNADGLLDTFYVKSVNGEMTLVHRMNNGSNSYSPLDEIISPITMEEYGDGGYDYYKLNFYFVDYNSDGYQDLIHGSEHNDNTYVRYFNGLVFEQSELIPVSTEDLPMERLTDVNGDGIIDYSYFHGHMFHQLGTSKKRDMIKGIYDGSSLKREIEYSTNVHTKDDDAPSENWGNGSLVTDVGAPIHLVKTTTKMDASLNSCNEFTCFEWFDFEYKGLKAQMGRGLLGYREFKITDHVQKKTIVSEYRQDFPFTGSLKSRTATHGNHAHQTITTTDILYATNDFGLAYPYSTTTETYENDLKLSNKTVEIFSVDEYGKPEIVYTVVRDPNKSLHFSTNEVHEYDFHSENYGGRLSRKMTYSDRAGSSNRQITDFKYFDDTGLLRKIIIDPIDYIGSSNEDESDQVYGVTTEYGRDEFGNITSTKISGSDGVERFSQVEFDTLGRHVTLSHVYPDYPSIDDVMTTSASYHSIFGTKISETSVNGQTSYLGYNTLGRLNFQSSPDGTYTTTDKILCSSALDCPARAYYKEEIIASHGPNSVIYFDALGQKVEEKTETLTCYNTQGINDICSGQQTKWIHKIYGYNNKGQKVIESRTHFQGDLTALSDYSNPYAPEGYASFISDSQGRPVTHYKADRSEWTTSYDGLSSSITNPDNNTTTKTFNVLGELVQMVDADQQVINYTYDALGSLRLASRVHSDISGGSGNLDTVILNDHLGRKILMNDPDKGIIEYRYNSIGELVWQKDNKDQISITYYDPLGRMSESLAYTDFGNGTLDSHIKFYYDLAENGLGLLQREEDLINGITRELTYNVMSQIIREETLFSNGRSFYNDIVYDDFFQVKQTYDASNANAGIEYGYYDNYLVTKTDLLSGRLLWKFLESDSIGNTIVYENGNGVVNYSLHDQNDGTLEFIMAIKGNSLALQHDEFNFNSLGNLIHREDLVVEMREDFNYDTINRLDDWTISFNAQSASLDVNYDHLGNIQYKTGMGNYEYGNSQCGYAGPHAVTKAGSNHYCYDANGNMISGGGRTDVQYNTNDKPFSISTNQNHHIAYHYGFGGSRFKRVDTSSDNEVKETLYIGNVEFISEEGLLTKVLRHMEGVALETYIPKTGVRQLEFLHRDHLGSVELITDVSGNVVKKFSYDPWGQRRDETSFFNTSFGQVALALTFAVEDFRRGYTGHEHIDEAGLIHMGGRVYDPRLGRFLSADPFVETTENIQSFNRYTYVLNNPLNATDPSGYRRVDDSFDNGFLANLYSLNGPIWDQAFVNDYRRTNVNGNIQLVFDTSTGNNVLSWNSFGDQGFSTSQGTLQGMGFIFNAMFEGGKDFFSSDPTGKTIVDFTPIVGDAKAINEAIDDPSLINIAVAGIGMLGPLGDGAAKSLKATKNIRNVPLGGADNIATAPQLKNQLNLQSAKSAFNSSGGLTSETILNSSKIIDSSQIKSTAIPKGFSKYTTQTFQSPSGNFQAHFYKNDTTGEVFYDQDYKAIFNKMSGNQ